ncbi:MAG: tRNA (N6-isopentenyl adenosine(37)-C2)-methylthiotransferase MiaB [Oscillospiraceae bacterium]|nr:tRNA (N6-isopentenyl adenosine(37)-C2)-methylthiotransferase MiaB [Oscillospiraceae bacterium]
MARVRAMTDADVRPRLAFVDTYGCQQNESDSEKLRGMLAEMGYGFTRDESEADIVVINTCAVREHAEMRILGNVGALSHTKRANREQIIAMCGCMVQEPGMAERIKRSYPYVDLVFGPHVLWRFPEYLERLLTKRKRIFETADDGGSIAEGVPVLRDGTVKAWLSIMYGCNNFCSYCIVPYVRGRERSRRPEDVLREARELVAGGYRDITLLGQNVNSYGKDLGSGTDFADIIRMVNAIPGEFLIRFMTSHPKDAGERLFAAMAESEKAARHIHLPFQAGSDRILAAMNRRYTKADYLKKVELAKSYMPDLVLTSDVIVGFPGETEEDFAETLDVIEKVRFDALFTFIYSKRPGTPAAEMPDDTPRSVKQERFERLLEVQNRISGEKHAQYVGRTVRVLVDADSSDDRADRLGRTNGGRLVHITGKAPVGSFADVEITDSNTWALYGRIV